MTGSSNADADDITEVLTGRVEAFERIVMRYESALFRVAQSRLGHAGLAEEAVQETFLCAFKSLHTYNSKYSFRTWLWSILINQCRRQYRHSQKHSSMAATDLTRDPFASQACSQPGPDAIVLSQEKVSTLHRLLAQLPQAQADALRLRFFGQLRYQEIADTMNCSLSTAKNRVRDGLLRLSDQLENDSDLRSTLRGDSS